MELFQVIKSYIRQSGLNFQKCYERDRNMKAGGRVSRAEDRIIGPGFGGQINLIVGFLIPQELTPFLKTIKYLSVTFYLYLSYMCISPEKNVHRGNPNVKRTEKEIALTNLMKAIAFTKK